MSVLNWASEDPLMTVFLLLLFAVLASSLAIKVCKTVIVCVWLWRNPGQKVYFK